MVIGKRTNTPNETIAIVIERLATRWLATENTFKCDDRRHSVLLSSMTALGTKGSWRILKRSNSRRTHGYQCLCYTHTHTHIDRCIVHYALMSVFVWLFTAFKTNALCRSLVGQ